MSVGERRGFALILVLALTMRVGAALYLGNTVSGLSGAQDEVSYSELGHRYAEGHGLTFPRNWYPWIKADAPQSYYSASMSLLLAGIYTVFGYKPLVARLLFAGLGTGVVAMVYLLARRLFDQRVATVAGLISAVYAYLVFYSVTLVTETPFTLALLISIYLAYDLRREDRLRTWIGLGITLAITLLFRMAVIFFTPGLLGWIAFTQRKHLWRLSIPVWIIIVAVAPFTYENHERWGRFLLLEAQFGHVFWNGNHPGHNWDFHPYQTFRIPAEVLASNNDAAITAELLRMGIQNVTSAPLHFMVLTATRLREFFTFWPTQDSTLAANTLRITSFGAVLPVALLGLWLTLSNWRRLLPVYLFLALHTGVYALTWTMIRYRVPMDTFFVIFAAVGLIGLVCRMRQGRWYDEAPSELVAN